MGFAALVSFILFFIKTSNPYVFLVFTFFSGLGQTFLVLEVWALVMDVIDYHEIRTIVGRKVPPMRLSPLPESWGKPWPVLD